MEKYRKYYKYLKQKKSRSGNIKYSYEIFLNMI